MKLGKIILATLALSAFFATVEPLSAQADEHEHQRHRVCHTDDHHHRSCHWAN